MPSVRRHFVITFVVGLLIIIAWIGVVGAGFYFAWWLWNEEGPGIGIAAFAGGVVILTLLVLLVPIGVAMGQIDLGDRIDNGCYYVSNESRVQPTGKTVMVYNDRKFFPFPCPAGVP
jgi:hypothetical protein